MSRTKRAACYSTFCMKKLRIWFESIWKCTSHARQERRHFHQPVRWWGSIQLFLNSCIARLQPIRYFRYSARYLLNHALSPCMLVGEPCNMKCRNVAGSLVWHWQSKQWRWRMLHTLGCFAITLWNINFCVLCTAGYGQGQCTPLRCMVWQYWCRKMDPQLLHQFAGLMLYKV